MREEKTKNRAIKFSKMGSEFAREKYSDLKQARKEEQEEKRRQKQLEQEEKKRQKQIKEQAKDLQLISEAVFNGIAVQAISDQVFAHRNQN